MNPDLLPHLATNEKIRLIVDSADEPVFGYLIGLSDDLALLHTFADFDPDGYLIVRTDDVEEVRRSEHEAFWDKMLAAENALSGLIRPPEIDLGSVRAAVASVAAQYPHMIIETEDTDEQGEEWRNFHLGVLLEAHDDFAEFHGYNGLGVWAEKPVLLWYSDITLIRFDTRYANAFWRHVPPRPPE